jgi:hypothetical protein
LWIVRFTKVSGNSGDPAEAGGALVAALVAALGPIALLDVVPDSQLAGIAGRGEETPAIWLAEISKQVFLKPMCYSCLIGTRNKQSLY